MRFMNHAKTALLLGAMLALCMLVGHFIGGPRGVLMGLLIGGLGNIIAFYFSDKIAVAAMGGVPVTRAEAPELVDMVERLAQRAGLPMPKVYVCPQEAPNAFATGRNPANAAVAVTHGMLRNFPAREIEGVIAHELAHIRHRDVLVSTIASVMAGMISYAGYMLLWFGGGRNSRDNPLGAIGMIVMIVLAPLAAMLIQAAVSRQREFAADNYGGELCGDPNKLADALGRLQSLNERVPTTVNPAFNSMFIMEPLSGGGIGSLFATHPPTAKRIAALRNQASGR
jgi:heat shock protein HtpX